MKKLFCLLLCLLMIAALAACVAAEDAKTEAEPEMTEEKMAYVYDGKLVVKLAGNPTTGYEWVCTAEGDDCLDGGDYEYQTDDVGEENLAGVGGVFTFRFAPKGEGSATLHFSYERSWEENSGVDEFTVTAAVDADGEITIG